MQIFEFHFNPRTKEGIVLDSFIYEPENVYEKELGNLCIAGKLTNTLPQNNQLLNNLSAIIKKNYYLISAKSFPEKSLKKGLEEANDFLENEEKKGNISWLGNLDLAIISLKDLDLYFTKVGDIKILLARDHSLIDIGKELESKESESPSLKIFSNIVAGKMLPEDKIIILTKEIFDIFGKENLFPEIISVFGNKEKPRKNIDWELKKVMDKKRNILSETSGLLLLMVLGDLQKENIELRRPVTLEREMSFTLPLFLINKFVKEKINRLSKGGILPRSLTALKNILILPKEKIKGTIEETSKKIKVPLLKKPSFSLKFGNLKKLLTVIVLLAIVLGSGNYIFKVQKQKESDKIQDAIMEIQKMITEAENAFIYNDQSKANLLYQESLDKILSLMNQNDKNSENNEIIEMKESVEKELFSLNNIEKINEPEVIFEFRPDEFSPQKMILSGSDLYFWNQNSSGVYILDTDKKEGKTVQAENNIESGGNLGDFVLFFSKPNRLISLKNKESIATKNLELPYSEFNPVDLSVFGSNIYFLDSQKEEIVKFKFEEGKNQFPGEIWIAQGNRKPSKTKSMAIDGPIWLLSENNSLLKYYKGEFQEEISLNFFPSPDGASRIITNVGFSYLYLLTPTQNRTVVLDKNGKVIKQYQSDKFNNLKDFAISENEEFIYLLNDLKIYRISVKR